MRNLVKRILCLVIIICLCGGSFSIEAFAAKYKTSQGVTINPEENGLYIEDIIIERISKNDEAEWMRAGFDPDDYRSAVGELIRIEVAVKNNFPITVYDLGFFFQFHMEDGYVYDNQFAGTLGTPLKAGQRCRVERHFLFEDPTYIPCYIDIILEFRDQKSGGKTFTVEPENPKWYAVSFSENATESYTSFQNIVSAGAYHSVFLRIDGTVGAVGRTQDGRCDVGDWEDIIAVSASSITAGLKLDGTVVATGNNDYGQCDTSKWRNIVAIDTGWEHTVGLRSDGTVVAAGNRDNNRCEVSSWKNIVDIAAGQENTYGLKSNGTVIAAGSDSNGQKNLSAWSNICQIDAGYRHVVGLKKDGTVVAAGANYYGQCDVSEWEDIVAVSAGNYYTLGLKSDGTVVAAGMNRDGQCDVWHWEDVIAISAGQSHSIGLRADGYMYTTGNNAHGQCDFPK